MRLISIEGEAVIEAFVLRAGLLDEPLAERLEIRELTVVDLEIGHDRAAGVLGRHRLHLLHLLRSCHRRRRLRPRPAPVESLTRGLRDQRAA